MLKKEDKDGIIRFLRDRISDIREAVSGMYVEDGGDMEVAGRQEALDLCDRTLLDTTF